MEPRTIKLQVEQSEQGMRLDAFIRKRLPQLSRGAVVRLIQRRQLEIDGHPAQKGQRLRPGQRVLLLSAAESEHPLPQPELPLSVLAVEPLWLVLNKAAGMPCHPLAPGEQGTVANALAARYPECVTASDEAREGGLAHRLDWGTSGALLAARSSGCYGWLRQLFASGQIQKLYLALVEGELRQPGELSTLLAPVPGERRRMQVVELQRQGATQATTHYQPLQRLQGHTLVKVGCQSGARHQVRAHLQHLGHPLAGDELYGAAPRQQQQGAFLHAWQLAFQDQQGKRHHYLAPLPATRKKLLLRLGMAPAAIADLEQSEAQGVKPSAGE